MHARPSDATTRPLPEIAGVDHGWVDVPGGCLHVALAGDPAGAPVLLLHGWPQHWYAFRHLLADPPAGLRLIAPDLPGYGWSSSATHRWAKEDVVTDIVALLDGLGLDRVGLVGHDWGGWVGFKLCLRAPERVSRYLALNMAHPYTTARTTLPHSIPILAYQPLVAAAGVPLHRRSRLVELILRLGVTDRSAVSARDVETFAATFRERHTARAATNTYRTFLLRELPAQALRSERRRLTVPTRGLFGVDDRAIATALVDPATALADDYEVEYVDGCGHFIAEEQPDLVRAAVVEWLSAR